MTIVFPSLESSAGNHASTHESSGTDPVYHDLLAGFVGNEHVDHSTVSIATQHSLTGGGDLTSTRTLNLVNDQASPAADHYYGTDAQGAKGFHPLPAGGGGGSSGGATGTGRVVEIIAVDSPAASAPLIETRDGGSTPAERQATYTFGADVDTYLDYRCWLSGYTGGGLTFTIVVRAQDTANGTVRLGLSIRRLDTAEDYDSAHSYDFNTVDVAMPDAAGKPSYVEIEFTDGADMDSVVDGELFVLRFRREGTHANDDLQDRIELIALLGEES